MAKDDMDSRLRTVEEHVASLRKWETIFNSFFLAMFGVTMTIGGCAGSKLWDSTLTNTSRLAALETTQGHHGQTISELKGDVKEVLKLIHEVNQALGRLPKTVGILLEVEGELVSSGEDRIRIKDKAGHTIEYILDKATTVEIDGRISSLAALKKGSQMILSFGGPDTKLQRIMARTNPIRQLPFNPG